MVWLESSVVLRPNELSKKFQILPLSWIVERAFSWTENHRRMTTDCENLFCTKKNEYDTKHSNVSFYRSRQFVDTQLTPIKLK